MDRQSLAMLFEAARDPGRAAEIQDESLEDYAQRRGIQISNPWNRSRTTMARKTIADYRTELGDLREQVEDLESENESLQEQLDEISSIASGGGGEG